MHSTKIIYQRGLPERFRESAAALYDEAFGEKFAVAVRSAESRRLLLQKCLMLDYAIVALGEDRLLGIAGFHTADGSLTGGITYAELLSLLGFIKGNCAALLFSLYEREPAPGELVMDGIAVQSDLRGCGIGSRLLDEITDYAAANHFSRVRLDVIDRNPKAQKLYARKGFRAVKTERFRWLRWLLSFGASTTMELRLDEKI